MAETDVKKAERPIFTISASGRKRRSFVFLTTPAMECLQGRIAHVSWRRRVLRCLLELAADANGSAYRGISTSRPEQSKAPTSTDSTTATTRPSDSLPRSPLAAQQKFEKKRKLQPKAADLHDLRRNPWAMALASPVRMCAITRTRLPRDFLGGWGLIQRPDDMEKLWLMPVELLKDELKASSTSTSTSTPLNYLKLRILNNLPMLRKLTTPLSRATGGKRSAVARIIPQRWKPPFGPMSMQDERRMAWRHDMPSFVLEHMRKETMKRLKAACSSHDAETDARESRVWTVVDLGSAQQLEEALGRIVGVRGIQHGALLVMDVQSTSTNLPEYVTLPQTQSRVPLLDLTVLLSKSNLEDLKTLDRRFQSAALFIRPDDSLAADALLHLWKIQGLIRRA